MIYAICEGRYTEDETFYTFTMLVEGDGDPHEVVRQWERQKGYTESAVRQLHPRPLHPGSPNMLDSEADVATWIKRRDDWRKKNEAFEAELAKIQAQFGATKLDALLKAGFKSFPHQVVAL